MQQPNTSHPNQHSINDINNNAIPPEPNINTFYTKWGDPLQPTKQPHTVWLVLHNFGGWLQWNNNKKTRSSDNSLMRRILTSS